MLKSSTSPDSFPDMLFYVSAALQCQAAGPGWFAQWFDMESDKQWRWSRMLDLVITVDTLLTWGVVVLSWLIYGSQRWLVNNCYIIYVDTLSKCCCCCCWEIVHNFIMVEILNLILVGEEQWTMFCTSWYCLYNDSMMVYDGNDTAWYCQAQNLLNCWEWQLNIKWYWLIEYAWDC